MNKKVEVSKNKNISWLYFCIGLIVISFYTSFADPFNVPKFIILFIGASYFLIDILFDHRNLRRLLPNNLRYLILIFILGMVLSSIFTHPKYIALFGDNLRKNGLITYICFLIVFLFTVLNFEYSQIRKFSSAILIINLFVSGYGILQVLNLDFVSWTKSGGIIGTLGNSNFAGVVYAFFAIFSLGIAFTGTSNSYRMYCYFNFFISIVCLLKTNARQSILVLIVGCLVLLINFLNKFRKSIKIFFLIFISGISVLSVMGIFNFGPFASFLYKDSIGVRIYYWKAAIKMMIHHPILGVGIDRYGSYFKEYRESTYPLKYGFDLTSTNAHNVYLQLFATSGLVTGMAYLGIMLIVFFNGIKLIRSASLEFKKFHTSIFAVWVAFQLQSLVSIDNIAVAIFNWFFSGAIIALSVRQNDNVKPHIKPIISKSLQTVIRPILMIPTLIICVLLSRVETNHLVLRNSFNPSSTQTKSSYINFAQKALEQPLLDPSYRTAIANSLLDYQEYNLGKSQLEISYKSDPRDLSTLWGLALLNEIQGNFSEGIKFRIMIEELDPWNAKNYLQLLNDYLKTNDKNNARDVLKKINSFAANTDEGKQANILFTTSN